MSDELSIGAPAAYGPASPGAEAYDAAYYAAHCGAPYERNDRWITFFGDIAARVVRDIAPTTVLDAGCAFGFLVEALQTRGVDACGIDVSEFAIGQVHESIRDRCSVGSILDPFPQRYDLITCIEVVEHLEPRDAEAAVANLCAHTDDVLLSTTPDDFKEPTHVNVRPPEYWTELFAINGFHHDVDYDASYVTPWAVRYRRSRDPIPRVLADYERRLWHLSLERRGRTTELVRMERELNDRHAELKRLGAELARVTRLYEAGPGALMPEVERLAAELSSSEAEAAGRLTQIERQARQLSILEAELAVNRKSTSMRLAGIAQHRVRRALPADTLRGRALTRGLSMTARLTREGRRAVAQRLNGRSPTPYSDVSKDMGLPNSEYERWRAECLPDARALNLLRQEAAARPDAPLVSILMPTYNSRANWLDDAIGSVLAQTYTNWELCVADDASPDHRVTDMLNAWTARDPRIRLELRADNGGIAEATNTALRMAHGELIAFLDHDDVLEPHALHASVAHHRAHPECVYTYSDEDKILLDGARREPYFKGDHSPDLLLANNYQRHFVVARRIDIEAVGGLRTDLDSSQDHDLLLRLSERGAVGHVADVLYGWRQVVPGSSALRGDAKEFASDAGVRAVSDALSRRCADGLVQKGGAPGWYTVRYRVTGNPLVSVVIPTRDRVDLLRQCIRSIETRTDWPNWEVVVVDNGSEDEETLDYLASLHHEVVTDSGYFNYSRLMNRGVRATRGGHVLMLNNDVEVITPAWMTAMLEHSQRNDVGGVGARLLYPNGCPQHEGIRIGRGIIAGNIDHRGYFNLGQTIRDVSAVTGACMMMRRDVFDEIDGFDERLRVAFNDVDLCLRIRRAGFRIVYQPLAELYHAESASRGGLHPMADERLLISLWGGPDDLADPYVSRHIAGYDPLTLRTLPNRPANAEG